MHIHGHSMTILYIFLLKSCSLVENDIKSLDWVQAICGWNAICLQVVKIKLSNVQQNNR